MQYTVTFLAWHICSFCQPFYEARQLNAAPVQKSIWEEYSGSPRFSKAAGLCNFSREGSEGVDQHNLMLQYQLGIVDGLAVEAPVRALSRNTIQGDKDLGVRVPWPSSPKIDILCLQSGCSRQYPAHTGTDSLFFFSKSNSREQVCKMFSGILK